LRVRFLLHRDAVRKTAERWRHPRTVVTRLFLPLGAPVRINTTGSWIDLERGVFCLLPQGMPFIAEYGQGRLMSHLLIIGDDAGFPIWPQRTAPMFLRSPTLARAVRESFAQPVPGELDAVVHRVILHFAATEWTHAASTGPLAIGFRELAALLQRTPPASWRIELLAQHMRCSAAALSKRFKRSQGVPMKRFLRQALMARVQEALLTTSQPASTIARQLGFDDPGYFHRVFRAETGMTPGEWRKKANR
jgi:AraC-like DNA-binding protein